MEKDGTIWQKATMVSRRRSEAVKFREVKKRMSIGRSEDYLEIVNPKTSVLKWIDGFKRLIAQLSHENKPAFHEILVG